MRYLTSGDQTTVSGLDAVQLGLEAEVQGVGSVQLQSVLFAETGTIGFGDSEIDVAVGSTQFFVEIPEWEFCNPCTSGNRVVSRCCRRFIVRFLPPRGRRRRRC